LITFKNVGHFFAKAYKAIVTELPKIEATKATVETVTAVIPGGAPALLVEDAAYAVLGAISAALSAGGAAAAQKLQDAGLDITAVQKAQALIASVPQLVTVAKSL
jgi:hypothetical protein